MEKIENPDANRSHDITIDEVKSFPMFAQFSDAQASEVVQTIESELTFTDFFCIFLVFRKYLIIQFAQAFYFFHLIKVFILVQDGNYVRTTSAQEKN